MQWALLFWFWCPIIFFVAAVMVLTARRWVSREVALIHQFGPEHALWVDQGSLWHLRPVASFVVAAIDTSLAPLDSDFILSSVRRVTGTPDSLNHYQAASLLWSWFVLAAQKAVTYSPTFWALCYSYLAFMVAGLAGRYVKFVWKVLQWTFAFSVFVLFASPAGFWGTMASVVFVTEVVRKVLSFPILRRLKLEITILTAYLLAVHLEYKFVGRKWFDEHGFKVRVGRKFQNTFSEVASKIAIVVSDLGLPSYILGPRKASYSTADVQETLELMKELGWPINTSLADPSRTGSTGKYVEWLLGGTDWEQGLHNRTMYLDRLLDPLRLKAVEWKRTEEYRSVRNELESISRYFKSPRYNYPDLPLDDVWFLLGDIFKFSRIAPFNHIIRMWEKKYALGSFMHDPDRPKKKYSRWKFISSIGYASFKTLWRRTFEIASSLTPVSHVSVKDEALPPRKYLEDKVRTVIGSPIGQYILSTVWNYWPNHNFRWETTPVKVGMPLNGYWFSRMYAKHARCQIHVAGDFSEFDSTVDHQIQRLIAAVRKRGYEHHRDYERICKLIDINYDQVNSQLLNTTSTGDIYRKGTGMTTGHSSTSMDNSAACVILYLMAWKDLTGLSAKEFKFYNELSVFGDDHVLSTLQTRPVMWKFSNIQQSMAKFGVTLRVEAEGSLSKIPFLSKFVRRPTPSDMDDLRLAGVAGHNGWVVYHDKSRLVGKLVSKVKSMAPEYRLKRLLSYLSLTAHHPDIYDQIAGIIKRTNTFSRIVKAKQIVVPSYRKVLQDWYSSAAVTPHAEMEEADVSLNPDNAWVQYGQVGPLDSLLGSLALLPDLINPTVFNFGYLRTFQARCAPICSWPIELVRRANSTLGYAEVAAIIRRSPYDVLDATIESDNSATSDSSLMLRHWIFVTYHHLTKGRRKTGILTEIHRKVANFQFLVNCKFQSDINRWSFPILDLLVITALGLIHSPLDFGFVMRFEVPDLADFFNRLSFFLFQRFWTALPPNYADVIRLVRDAKMPTPITVEAPTGSGKSTAFIKACADNLGHKFKRVVVVEPRSAIVKTTVPYCQQALGMDCTGSTVGMYPDSEAKVVYCTGTEFLLHQSWWSAENLVILDEAHITEATYLLVHEILKGLTQTQVLFLTATPSPSLLARSTHIPLNTARIWQVNKRAEVHEGPRTVHEFKQHYMEEVQAILKEQPSKSKALVFFNTVAECLAAVELIGSKAAVLSSGVNPLGVSAYSVICTTSVADVGLTLPDVNLVITSDIGFLVRQEKERVVPMHTRLSHDQIEQRCGRTGRTSHGQALILRYPKVIVNQDLSSLEDPSTILSLLASGAPVSVLSSYCRGGIMRLMGLDQEHGPAAEDLREEALRQLDKYTHNLGALVRERVSAMEMSTNDGSIPSFIDTARMGLLRESTRVSTLSLLGSVLDISASLAKRMFSGGSPAPELDALIREQSAPLLGNIKAELPFPDPDLGEWGFT
uniref:RNA-dependent RNA polymerase n=1 Tax=Sodiomyces alkalinus fusarivirus 1 TaxID=1917080 RepID=A0A2D1VMI0_9VIRU|nr:RNA-dependent RNA polymerase [Sodiomyces alkalinus fusarivirus 1]